MPDRHGESRRRCSLHNRRPSDKLVAVSSEGFDLEDELFMGRVDDGFGLDATTTKRCLAWLTGENPLTM